MLLKYRLHNVILNFQIQREGYMSGVPCRVCRLPSTTRVYKLCVALQCYGFVDVVVRSSGSWFHYMGVCNVKINVYLVVLCLAQVPGVSLYLLSGVTSTVLSRSLYNIALILFSRVNY